MSKLKFKGYAANPENPNWEQLKTNEENYSNAIEILVNNLS